MPERSDYDVAIVGGSIAGSAAATFLGRRGARVALIERHADPAAYKTMCTHFIQPGATPTIERLGLAEAIEAAGGIRNGVEAWTRWGWVRPEFDDDFPYATYGYDIRREKLDPMLRELAARTPGVELMVGTTVTGLVRENGRVAGVSARRRDGTELELATKLVVGADGRGSQVARMAGVPGRVKPHNRFCYFAYYRDLPLPSGERSMFWFLDPDCAYMFPNDDGLTLVAAFPTNERRPEFKRDLEGSFTAYFDGLDRAPSPREGERVSKLMGKLDMPNVMRPASAPGIAFVGDAAMAADPVWGVGCGWALQSAEWLGDIVGDAVAGAGDLDVALAQYRKFHRRQLLGHYLFTSDYSSGRKFNPFERLFFSAAARDPKVAQDFAAFGGRCAPPTEAIKAPTLVRAVWALGSGRRPVYAPSNTPERERVAA